MLGSIIVPVDGTDESERGVGVAAVLAARASLPVELFTVVRPGDSAEVARDDLGALVRELGPGDHSAKVIRSPDVVEAIVDELERHADGLALLGTSARGPITELLLGSVSEAVLARSTLPVLLVGPNVRPASAFGPALVAAVASDGCGSLLAPWLVEWRERFGVDPWFVQVAEATTAGAGRPATETGLVHRLADRLRHQGIDAQWDVLHGRDTADALVDFTATMGGGVIVVASERWTDSNRIRLASTARSIVQRSPYPVLVVPVHVPLRAAG